LIKEKYHDQIAGISEYNNVDLNVAYLMLIRNPINIDDGVSVYQGAGEIDYDELRKDIAVLDSLRRV
jgi:hypothetical protein